MPSTQASRSWLRNKVPFRGMWLKGLLVARSQEVSREKRLRGGMRCHTRELYNVQSWVDKYRTGSGRDRVMGSTQTYERHKSVAKPNPAECSTRSLPPPHAGCPRGDPGPLPVLHLSTQRRTLTASGYEGLRAMLYILFVAKSSVDGFAFADRIANSEGQAQNIQTKEMARHTWEPRRES